MDDKTMSASLLNDYLSLSRRDRKAVRKALPSVDQLRLKRLLRMHSQPHEVSTLSSEGRMGEENSPNFSPGFEAHLADLSKYGKTGSATLAFIATIRKAGTETL